MKSGARSGGGLRYQVDETPPAGLTLGLGLQLAVISVTAPILIPTVVMRAAGAAEAHLNWAVFAAIAISGAATVLQTIRYGRIGAGNVLVMGSSGAFIAICITALTDSGPAVLATLVIAAALFQLLIAEKLALLSKVLTPAVSGTVIMLIPVSVMPVVFDLMTVPEAGSAGGSLLSAGVTFLAMTAIALRGNPTLRLWGPVVGIVTGSLVAAYFGLYDFGLVAGAAWIGPPSAVWPGLDLSFGTEFWTLLPAFLLVAAIGAIRTISSAVAVQRVSWRRQRAADYRSVQGAVSVDGLGNLLCGFAGTVPNTAYSVSVSMTELTGVGARTIGTATGAILLAMAFLPKALAVVLAIPGPVFAAYLAVLLAMLFIVGMRMVILEGGGPQNVLIAGIAFWVGIGFESGTIFPQVFSEFAGGLLQNGMTAGGITVILLTLFMSLTEPRRGRIKVRYEPAAHLRVRQYLDVFAGAGGWSETMTSRLEEVVRETMRALFPGGAAGHNSPRLVLSARKEGAAAVLDLVVSGTGMNLEDGFASLGVPSGDGAGAALQREEADTPLRRLRELASSVRHQQFHDTDVLMIRVEAT